MQTYRECERQFELNFENDGPFTCDQPLIFADLVLGVGDDAVGVLQKPGAGRTVTFAGAHGDLKYGVQLCPGEDNQELTMIWRVYSALMVLPIAENSRIAPALLPNIARARTMLSVVPQSQSDTERRILWYRMDKLQWVNNRPGPDPGNGCFTNDFGVLSRFEFVAAAGSAFYGRTWPSIEAFRVKARARLTEREGLFLIRNITTDTSFGNVGVFALFADAYLRFAVK